jgi:hypothetical protein
MEIEEGLLEWEGGRYLSVGKNIIKVPHIHV